ncbi:uncharacterized protein [Nicotiana sylvestris]|uniref:uncharacterized protein n=1 Tax=Nicotiana sylvestris TaxID=4096 RepID=UPI00388C58E1
MWAKHGINKISILKNGIVLVRFDTEMGKTEVVQGRIYHFDNKTFIMKTWNPSMEFNMEGLYFVPICVKLPYSYWNPKGLSKIGSLIGKPSMIDQQTEKKIGLNFARLIIDVDIDTLLLEKIMFRNERGNLIEQKIQYDWKPILCKCCNKYGHNEEACRKKQPRPKSPEKQIENQAAKAAKKGEKGKEKTIEGAKPASPIVEKAHNMKEGVGTKEMTQDRGVAEMNRGRRNQPSVAS